MQAEYLAVYQGCQGQVVEQVSEVLPHVGIAILAEALVVEAVDLGDLPGLVVPPEDGDPAAVPDLASKDSDTRERQSALP